MGTARCPLPGQPLPRQPSPKQPLPGQPLCGQPLCGQPLPVDPYFESLGQKNGNPGIRNIQSLDQKYSIPGSDIKNGWIRKNGSLDQNYRISSETCFGHEMSLESVSVADFWCKMHSATSPIDLDGFRGDPGDPEIPESIAFSGLLGSLLGLCPRS